MTDQGMTDQGGRNDRPDASEVFNPDAIAECEGTFDPSTGECQVENHTHCPWCREIHDCPHELATWSGDEGMGGVEIPELDESLADAPALDAWRETVPPDLHALFEAYALEESVTDVLDEALAVAGVEVDCQGWEMTQSMASGSGSTWYVEDRDAARAALATVWHRLDEARASVLAARPLA